MLTAESFLSLDGVELLNDLRTLTYLRRGLGSNKIDVKLATPLTPELGYGDTYDDEYHADPFWPGNLLCYCTELDGGPYVSPSADPAPWFDSTRPESTEFLGLIGTVQLGEVLGRAVTPRSSGGATIGPELLKPRIVAVNGVLYATSLAGIEWGQRWLAQQLAGQLDGTATGEAKVLPGCAPVTAAEPLSYFRSLLGVGLVDGPVYDRVQDIAAGLAQTVAFQLSAGRPHLRLPAVDVIAETNLHTTPSPCGVMAGPASLGDAAARISVHAGQIGSSIGPLTITATWDSVCPSSKPPAVTYPVLSIPRGCVLTIDSSTRTVTVSESLTGVVLGGPDALDITSLFPWVVAGPGEHVCICVDASAARLNAGSLVRVEAIGREL